MRFQPAAHGTAFAILFVVPVPGHDEFRDQRHDTVMSGCHQCRGEQSVVVFGLAIAVPAGGTIVATHIVGAVVLCAVKCDQHMVTQPPERFDATRSLQFIEHVVEHRVKLAGFDRVQLRADLAVSGDFSHAEQCFGRGSESTDSG
jgi:hypothetical protein